MQSTQELGSSTNPNLFLLFFKLIFAISKEICMPLFIAFYPLLLVTSPYIIGAGVISILLLIIALVLRIMFFMKQQKEPTVFLEITPSHTTLESQFSTEQLFTTMHSIVDPSSWIDKTIGNCNPFSFELVSTKEKGIRYIIKTSPYNATLIEKNLSAYLPSVEVSKINDYLPTTMSATTATWQIIELKLKKHFAIPLVTQSKLTNYDPIAYITGHMTQLSDNDLISMQLVMTPVYSNTHPKITEDISSISNGIYRGRDITPYLHRSRNLLKRGIKAIFMFIPRLIFFIILSPFQMLLWWFSNDKRTELLPFHIFDLTADTKRTQNELSQEEQEFQQSVGEKIQNELFEASFRLLVVGDSSGEVHERVRGFLSSLSPFEHSYQTFKIQINPIISLLQYFPSFKTFYKSQTYLFFKYRLLSITGNPIFSVAEIASLYHFPFSTTTETEDIVKNKTPSLPAPLLIKNTQGFSNMFATNSYANRTTYIGLSVEERRRHMYIIGATGTGKTTLLLKMIFEDMINGNGLAVVDPHGDLSDRILGVVPKSRIKDIIYINPYDIEHPIGINLLEIPKGLSTVETQREKDLIVSTIISIFHKLYTDRFWGPKMEHVLRNTILTALELEEPTFMTIYTLLTNSKFRKDALRYIQNDMLKNFWNHEFDKLTTSQKADTISPITNKLSIFLTTAMARNIINQKHSTLDFTSILDTKKIVICDLSKGKIGEDTSAFLGGLIVAKLQLAAYRRVHIPENKRVDFYLYIDEFQNFATESFAELLSEARKYRLNAILAHQTISQIEDKNLLKVILANAGTIISFRTSNPSDEDMILPLFSPQVKKNEIANLQSYTFYIKLQAIIPQDAFTGKVDNFIAPENIEIKKKCVEYSQKTYGVPVSHISLETEHHLPKKEIKAIKKDKYQTSILERIHE